MAGGGSPLRIYVSNGDEYTISVFRVDGTLERLIRAPGRQLPISTDERSFARQWLVWRNAKTDAGRANFARIFDLLPQRTHHPPVSGLFVDRSGALWVREKHEQWSVFSAEGRWLAVLKIPLWRIFDVGEDYILGVATDADGVERVEEYRLARAVY